MKNKVIVWIGLCLLTSFCFTYSALADSKVASGTTPSIPIASPPSSGSQIPSALPQDLSKVTPPTGAQVNPNPPSLPTMPGNINVAPVPSQGAVTTPSGTVPTNPNIPMNPGSGGMSSPAEPVINNYSPFWYLSPWFISLMVLTLVIILLVVYSLLEGRMPKEEKESETAVSNKKKKSKK